MQKSAQDTQIACANTECTQFLLVLLYITMHEDIPR